MAVAGPNYCLYADISTNGRVADEGVFNRCSLLHCLEEWTLGIPQDKPLPFGEMPLPFVFLGDDAFALRPFVMKPFHREILHWIRGSIITGRLSIYFLSTYFSLHNCPPYFRISMKYVYHDPYSLRCENSCKLLFVHEYAFTSLR